MGNELKFTTSDPIRLQSTFQFDDAGPTAAELAKTDTDQRRTAASTTFTPNMSLPVHRWFRFSAGFSAEWVAAVIADMKNANKEVVVLDPFAGVATTLVEADKAGVRSYGLEAQPYVARIAEAKLLWHADIDEFLALSDQILERAARSSVSLPEYPELILKCYPEASLSELHRLRLALEDRQADTPAYKLAWLALNAILRRTSTAGTAPWQYVLPNKTKKHAAPPLRTFAEQCRLMAKDMWRLQTDDGVPLARVWQADARVCAPIADGSITLVITSPPYPNNYDYADATRLEMTFFGEVQSWSDLHPKARQHLVTSCSQHASAAKLPLDAYYARLADTPIFDELRAVCDELASLRTERRGRKDYDRMVAGYFADLAEVWRSLRRVCREGADVCFVVGDSAPYGVHVPVERWLGELAVDAGFRSYRFEETRRRNVKWRNRKHTVPLHEGRLWVQG